MFTRLNASLQLVYKLLKNAYNLKNSMAKGVFRALPNISLFAKIVNYFRKKMSDRFLDIPLMDVFNNSLFSINTQIKKIDFNCYLPKKRLNG